MITVANTKRIFNWSKDSRLEKNSKIVFDFKTLVSLIQEDILFTRYHWETIKAGKVKTNGIKVIDY